MSEEKYKIQISTLTDRGEWDQTKEIETGGYLLMADIDHGKGMDAHCMNLSDKDILLMLTHYPIVRRLIVLHFPMFLMAEKLLGQNESRQDDQRGMPIDAEALLSHVPGAEKPQREKPLGTAARIWHALRRKQ